VLFQATGIPHSRTLLALARDRVLSSNAENLYTVTEDLLWKRPL